MFATVICLNQHFVRQSDNFYILDVSFEERKDVNNSANVRNLNIRFQIIIITVTQYKVRIISRDILY